ncbi:MAG: hypothetical protein GF370_04830 [Candidatus Nealsonbacteria bacterium]|nr:hypothetical protein [Candidatus Nealsonbacteria bacterium]
MVQEIFYQTWNNLTHISPSLLSAGLVLLGGIFLSKIAEGFILSFLRGIRLNRMLERTGIKQTLSRVSIKFDAPRFFADLVQWSVIIFFLMTSSEIVGLIQLSSFLQEVITYLPNVFIAVIIFIVALFLADFSQKVVIGTLEREKIIYSKFLGTAIRWTIWFFAILAILYQLKITPSLILAIFIGMVATISLALGIAFGLGGKDLAARILKELEEKFK